MITIMESMKQKTSFKPKERKLFNKIYVWEKDSFPEDVDLDVALEKIVKIIPKHFFRNVEGIYIGQFPELINRSLNAMYADNAIYISNSIIDTEELIKNIVHEIAHSMEETIAQFIGTEDQIANEFLVKRNQLKKILHANGYNVAKQDFDNLEYDEKFDGFLYNEVGYPAMSTITANIFVSPYGATSYREYYANGFEHYFLNDFSSVKTISPRLFDLLTKIQKTSFFKNY